MYDTLPVLYELGAVSLLVQLLPIGRSSVDLDRYTIGCLSSAIIMIDALGRLMNAHNISDTSSCHHTTRPAMAKAMSCQLNKQQTGVFSSS